MGRLAGSQGRSLRLGWHSLTCYDADGRGAGEQMYIMLRAAWTLTPACELTSSLSTGMGNGTAAVAPLYVVETQEVEDIGVR